LRIFDAAAHKQLLGRHELVVFLKGVFHILLSNLIQTRDRFGEPVGLFFRELFYDRRTILCSNSNQENRCILIAAALPQYFSH
jgi:hypothetical protein